MAVQLEFHNFILPISIIKAKYPGGWEQCLIDHEYAIGRRVWYDDYLFRDGGMGPIDIKCLLNKWQSMGLKPHLLVDDKPVGWLDMCVIDGLTKRPTLPCSWISINHREEHASLTNAPPCTLVNRASFTPTDRNSFLR
jgi:hypothetical protein